MNVVASIRSGEGATPSRSPAELNPVGEFHMINVGDFRMIIDKRQLNRATKEAFPKKPSPDQGINLANVLGRLRDQPLEMRPMPERSPVPRISARQADRPPRLTPCPKWRPDRHQFSAP